MLELEISKYSQKFIKKNKSDIRLIKKLGLSIKNLRDNPLPNGAKKLIGYSFYRIRVNNYRIIYKYDEKTLYISVIEKRDKVYGLLNKI